MKSLNALDPNLNLYPDELVNAGLRPGTFEKHLHLTGSHDYSSRYFLNLMSFYKYRHCTHCHLDALAKNELWFSRGITFNDPFDGQPPLNLMTYNSMANFVRKQPLLKLLNEDKFNEIVVQQIEEANMLYKEGRFSEHSLYEYFQFISESVTRSFIFCLSQSNENILMWSHYSDSHKGFCIKYNLEILLDEIEFYHHEKVSYSNKIPDVLNSIINGNKIDFLKQLLFLKSEDWHYEKEYRLVLNDIAKEFEDKGRSVNYSNEAIEAIYFGIKTNEKDKSKIKEIVADKGVSCYQMEAVPGEFRVSSKI